MRTLIVKKSDTSSPLINVDDSMIPASDFPYYVQIEGDNKKLTFEFINKSERQTNYEDKYFILSFGKVSGKIYRLELKDNSYLNKNRIKLVKHAIIDKYSGNNRFKSNIKWFFDIVKNIYENDELITGANNVYTK